MTLRILTSAVLAAGSLTLCAGAMAQASAPTPTPMQGATTQKLAGADKNFLENAAQAGHAEIEGSKLAETKSTNPDVKAFAAQMIKDHTKVGAELDALAATKGYTPPTGPSIVQTAKIKTLGALSGTHFDKMYASQIGVSAHEDAVKLFKENASKAKDPDIKAFAAKNAPALEHHLEMARTLQQKVDK